MWAGVLILALAVADSAQLHREARRAQHAFELLRRRHLPWTAPRGSGPCDERIGRFCLWFGDPDPSWTPPPEPAPVRRARAALLDRLETIAAQLPGDGWVVGQLVRYALEHGDTARAERAAAGCRGDPAWCALLRAWVAYERGDGATADSLTAAAEAALPPPERARWRDLSPILPDAELGPYRRLPPPARAAAEEAFWQLADPLVLVPGNDRRAAHRLRWVLDRLAPRSELPEDVAWGEDLRRLLLRYGWPVAWERVRPSLPTLQDGGIVSIYPPRSWHFSPPLRAALQPTRLRPDAWTLADPRAYTGHTPRYAARAFVPLAHQVAAFRRQGAPVWVVAIGWAGDTALARLRPDPHAPVQVGAFVGLPGPWRGVRDSAAVGAGRATLVLSAPADTTVLSVEAWVPAAGWAGRARYAVVPPPAQGPAVSGLLLLRPEGSVRSLADALAAARGDTVLAAGERVGLYWETYDIAADSAEVALRLEPRSRPRWWAGWRPAPPPLELRWTERPLAAARSLILGLPALRPGAYRLRLEIRTPDGRRWATEQGVAIR